MSAISDLERKLSQLELAGLPNATLSSRAVLQIIDPHSLAVVAFDNRNTRLIEQSITKENLGATEITVGAHHITIKIWLRDTRRPLKNSNAGRGQALCPMGRRAATQDISC